MESNVRACSKHTPATLQPLFSPPSLTQSLWCIKYSAAHLPSLHTSPPLFPASPLNLSVWIGSAWTTLTSLFGRNTSVTSSMRPLPATREHGSHLPFTSPGLLLQPPPHLWLAEHCPLHHSWPPSPWQLHCWSFRGSLGQLWGEWWAYCLAQYYPWCYLCCCPVPGSGSLQGDSHLVPGSQARPDNIFFPCWSLGHFSIFDVLIISHLQEFTIAEAAQTPGHALQVGVQRKLAKNVSACHSSGSDFVPLVAETLGGMAEDTIHTIVNISKAIEDRCGPSDSAPTSRHLFGCLAVASWQGNASLWLHQLPLPGRHLFCLKKNTPSSRTCIGSLAVAALPGSTSSPPFPPPFPPSWMA